MDKYFKHFWTITKHKYYVGIECFKIGLYWQGLIHDLSKYSFTEFFISAKYFQGDSTPIAKEKSERGYSIAWLNHKGKNKHHWEYWTDFYDGEIRAIDIPIKYIKEMACDMNSAAKVYGGGTALEYFEKHRKNFLMTGQDKEILFNLLLVNNQN